MRESSLYTAVNLATGGRLPQILTEARDDGKSFDEIAGDLLRDTGIRVSREWIRKQVGRVGSAA